MLLQLESKAFDGGRIMQLTIDVTQSTNIIDDFELLCSAYEALTSLCQGHECTSAVIDDAGNVLSILNIIQRELIEKLAKTKA